jgi:hypothetical protein
MKTTIDIPDALYKKAKIRAIERGQTLKDIVLTSLIKELEPPSAIPAPGQSFMERRLLLPEFARFEAEGAFTPHSTDRDITELISDDRDGH